MRWHGCIYGGIYPTICRTTSECSKHQIEDPTGVVCADASYQQWGAPGDPPDTHWEAIRGDTVM